MATCPYGFVCFAFVISCSWGLGGGRGSLVATGKSHVNCCNLKRFSRRRDARESGGGKRGKRGKRGKIEKGRISKGTKNEREREREK